MAWLMENWESLLVAVNAGLAFAIAVSLLVPGEQPEKALRAIADALSKISKK